MKHRSEEWPLTKSGKKSRRYVMITMKDKMSYPNKIKGFRLNNNEWHICGIDWLPIDKIDCWEELK